MTNQRFTQLALFVLFLLATACRENDHKDISTQTPSMATPPPASQVPQPTIDTSTRGKSDEPIIIHLVVEDYELTTYERLLTVFEGDNPDIAVELLTVNDVLGDASATGSQIEKPLKLAESADVLAVYTSGGTVRAGLRMDMTPLIAADNSFNLDDFYAGLLEAYQWDGKTWAIPLTAEFDLLVYNKALFDNANVDYPTTDWTWQDVLEAALALTLRENGDVVQWGFADPQFGLTLFPNMTGSLLASNTAVPQPRFEDPALISEVQWYTDLFVVHQVAPYPSGSLDSLNNINTFLSELHTLVQTGKVAMWIDSSTFLTDSFIPSDANWGITPLPGCSPAYAGTVSISAGTQNPAAAWRLVRFLSQQFVIAGATGDLPQMPARRSVAEAGGFYGEVNSELTDALRYAVDHACPTYKAYQSVGANEAFSAFQIALGNILAGNKPVSTALSDAQTTAETNISELLAVLAQATPIPPFTVSAAADTAVSNQPTTAVTFNVLGGADEATAFQQIAQQFTAVHPDTTIDVTAVQGATNLTSNATQAACFQSIAGFTPGKLDAFLSLDPLLDADPDLAAGDFYPQALAAFSANGRLWALPGQMDVMVMAYNKALFDAAGVPYPQAGWTTADFLTTAQALTQGEGEDQQYGFLPGAFETTDLLDWLERLGANLLDEAESPPALALNDPSAIAALQWYTDLTTIHGIRPSFEGGVASLQNSDERRALIENGRAAMWLDSSFSQGGRPLVVENVGYVPLPVGVDGRSPLSVQSMTGYFISAQTNAEERQACWQWITYLTTRPDADVGLPARVSTAVSPEYAQLAGGEKAAAQQQSASVSDEISLSTRLEQEQPWLLLPFRTPSGSLSAQLMTQIIGAQVPVAQALAEAQGQLDIYRQCVLESGTTAVPGGQLSCWRQATAR